MVLSRLGLGALACVLLLGCPPPPPPPTDGEPPHVDAAIDAPDVSLHVVDAGHYDATPGTFCSIAVPVPGAGLPAGFCISQFSGAPDYQPIHSAVREPRTLSFAPNGDLFVGSPQQPGAGGGTGGPGNVLVLSDDNHDGVAEISTFLSAADVHGIAVTPNALYFTSAQAVMQTPYVLGQRTGQPATMFASIPNTGRITHGLARTVGGTMYYSTGVYGAVCPETNTGFITQVNPDGSTSMAASGFRNPMYMRCHYQDEVCLASELGDDGGGSWGAHEKLLVVRPATNYGYPCCAGQNQPAPGSAASCATVAVEEVSFPLNDTPFGMDWERNLWPAPYTNVVCVAKHGSFYSSPAWRGVGVYCAPTDPTTHVPNGPFVMFIDGFGAGGNALERPADIAFAADGRMFFSDDLGNAIYWVAPFDLPIPAH